jgi:hypothetical protein
VPSIPRREFLTTLNGLALAPLILPSVFDAHALRLARQHQVTPVAAINTFRYARQGDGAWKAAEADARRLLALGVRYFQIDSVYQHLFVE